MFQLLHGDLTITSSSRKRIAHNLLESTNDRLDHTTIKIKRLCIDDIRSVAVSGKLEPGSRLHGILSIAGLNLKLEAGELESLNSQIKSSIAQASTVMSLELLSSRVVTRKSLTMGVAGRPTIKTLKPLAEGIASHATLYQGCEKDILGDSERWAVAPPIHMTSCSPTEFDPSMKLTDSERWGLKFNKLLMKALRHHQKDNTQCIAIGFCFRRSTHDSAYIVGELAGRTCQAQALEPVNQPSVSVTESDGTLAPWVSCGASIVDHQHTNDDIGIQQKLWQLPKRLQFQSSVSILGEQHEDVSEQTEVDLFLCEWTICCKSELTPTPTHANRVQYKLGNIHYIARLVKRKAYTRKPRQCRDNMDVLIDGDGNDNDIDNGDNRPDGSGSDGELEAGLEELIEREMCGDDCDGVDELESDLQESDLGRDLFELDEINARFVAAARNRQSEKPFCKSEHVDVNENERSFEDALGEELLQFWLHHDKEEHSEPPRPVTPTIELGEDHIQDALRHWSTKMNMFSESCAHMMASLSSFEPTRPAACLKRDVSLLVHGGGECDEVSFVTWVKPYDKLEGRTVALDETNSLIYPSHFVGKTHFANSIMIVPECGARIKKQSRDQVSDTVLNIQKIFQVGLSTLAYASLLGANRDDVIHGCMFDDSTGATCIACGHGNTDVDAAMRQCAACLLWWHDQCSTAVQPYVNSYVTTHEVTMPAMHNVSLGDIPFILLHFT